MVNRTPYLDLQSSTAPSGPIALEQHTGIEPISSPWQGDVIAFIPVLQVLRGRSRNRTYINRASTDCITASAIRPNRRNHVISSVATTAPAVPSLRGWLINLWGWKNVPRAASDIRSPYCTPGVSSLSSAQCRCRPDFPGPR